jgi:hypothetical protein
MNSMNVSEPTMQPTVTAESFGNPKPPGGHYEAMVIEDRVSIPAWVVDLATFRRWTLSDDYPEAGTFAYLAGQLWVDLIELEGTPDVVLEIVSDTSVAKDTKRLRELYWRAGVPEYWLVDARSPEPRFEILCHTPAGYVAAEARSNGLMSAILGRAVQLNRSTDPLGRPSFDVRLA